MSKAVALYEDFAGEIARREDELANILPPHISRERFQQIALIAVKNTPDLLTKADRKSLHKALTFAAEDGLHPDGREGAITMFKNEAVWSPMTYGLRKRAKELCNMVIDAQVVYANDEFVWVQGDEPRLEHRPAPLGSDRGDMIGCYAIFKVDGVVLHREVMDKKEIEKVRSCSRNQNGLMWTKFSTEGWRKTVIRRGIKTVPSVPALERMIGRVDEEYPEFGPPKHQGVALESIPSAPTAATNVVPISARAAAEDIAEEPAEAEIVDAIAEDIDEPAEAAVDAPSPPQSAASKPAASQPKAEAPAENAPLDDTLEEFYGAISKAETLPALNVIWEKFEGKLQGNARNLAADQFEARYMELS